MTSLWCHLRLAYYELHPIFDTMCGLVARRGRYGKFGVAVCFSFGDILGFRVEGEGRFGPQRGAGKKSCSGADPGVSPFKMHYSIAFKCQSITGRPPVGEILYPPLVLWYGYQIAVLCLRSVLSLSGTPLFQMFQPPPRLSRSPPRLLPPLHHSSARRPRVCSLIPLTATSSSTATMDTLTSRTAPPTCTSTPRWWYDTSSPRLFFVNLNEHHEPLLCRYTALWPSATKFTVCGRDEVEASNCVFWKTSTCVYKAIYCAAALVKIEKSTWRIIGLLLEFNDLLNLIGLT